MDATNINKVNMYTFRNNNLHEYNNIHPYSVYLGIVCSIVKVILSDILYQG